MSKPKNKKSKNKKKGKRSKQPKSPKLKKIRARLNRTPEEKAAARKRAMEFFKNAPPMPSGGMLAVSTGTIKYVCCTEDERTPGIGCGFKFYKPEPTSSIKCPKCGNFWVKWIGRSYEDGDYRDPRPLEKL